MNRIHHLIDSHPADAPALILDDGTTVAYGELRDLAATLARDLAAHGLCPGDRLVVVAENGLEWATAVFAASRGDLWLTLINARQSAEEVARVTQAAGARAILCTAAASPEAAAHAQRLGTIPIGALPSGPVQVTPVRDATPEPVDPGPGQVAALLYTTGTTSAPKGVMLTHDNLIFNAGTSGGAALLTPADKVLCVLPGTHIYALASVFLPAMKYGAAVRLMTRFDAGAVMVELAHGITRFPGVPQMFTGILALMDRTGRALDAPALRAIAAGGAPLDPDLKARTQAVFGLPLNNGYGMTETAPSIAATRTETPRDDLAVGHPYEGVEIRIHDPRDDGVGEIWIRGRNVMKGYYNDPARSAEVLTSDGWFRSGDLGRLGEDGALFVVGRLKELIIRSGFNVYPPEVEAMLTRHPDVREAAVVGRTVPGNEEILAFVTLSAPVAEDDLKAFLRGRFVAYKVPQRIVVVDELPAASTGKYLKHTLVERFADLLG